MPQDVTTTNTDELRSFSQFIAQVDDGGLHHDVSMALTDLVGDLNNARAEGLAKPSATLTITLKLTLDGPVVEVVGDFTTKKPKLPRAKSVFYTTAGNNLSRSNPRQMKLPLRDVTTTTDDARAV